MDDEYPIVAEREYEHGTVGGDADALLPHALDWLDDIAYYTQHLFVVETNLGHALLDS
jgi:hypothetical protein